ncbi:fungal-specific transcription factor domain-containing protein [Cokeromyces recurvatus]|uniref:fungal-specific transcription factor domain-containing protein n=1 Tax=Cokeromyces recurvatus TaxID=90255 RepID=UPI00221FFCA6|nr:fungal-specific transcription factor domain-containing protein [Cokeromyces recurvatus]KAI7906005.1 fungal-specific transcription factor domain-containing protein [Cokeromyces recurvatus]
MSTLHDHIMNQPKEKRLKVSKACFTCRIKKIKCDGLQPCMQCKARKRPCSFSKNGSIDQTQRSHVISSTHSASLQSNGLTSRDSLSNSVITSTQSLDIVTQRQIAKEQDNLRKTSEQLNKLSMMWPGEGKEGHWIIDIRSLFNEDPRDQNSYQPHPSLPSININKKLLHLFFRHRHPTLPIIPKSIFYRLLEHRDPLISPLLLYSMYCHAAHFSYESASEADYYFKHAQLLLDTYYMDTPSLSVVIALCLMSTYESNRRGSGPHARKIKASVYQDMACRMCYDLNLHKRYSFHHTGTTPDETELRKRVYWVAYCLDKIHSIMTTGKPFLLSIKDIDIDLPMILGDPNDDPDEYEINVCFIEQIKLMQLAEHIFQSAIPNRYTIGIMIRFPEAEQLVLRYDSQLMHWLQNLPSALQWTPLNENTDQQDIIPTEPPKNAHIAYLHLVFNFIHISLLQNVAFTSLPSSPTSLIIQQRCATLATNLTQLTCALAEQPNFILSFQFVAETIMVAVRFHIIYCADERQSKAKNARFMFQRSLRSMESILHHRVIDGIQKFVTTIEKVLADADMNQSSTSCNSSPKFHFLSPIIPRTTSINPPISPKSTIAFISSSILPQQQQDHTADNSRWIGKYNGNHMHHGGLISPTSSIASTPLENNKSFHQNIVLCNDDFLRSHLTRYHHPTELPTASFTISAGNHLWKSSTHQHMPYNTTVHQNNNQVTTTIMNQSTLKRERGEDHHSLEEMYSHLWPRACPLGNDMKSFNTTEEYLDRSFTSTIRHNKQRQQLSNMANNSSLADAKYTNAQHDSTTMNNNNDHAMEGNDLYTVWNYREEDMKDEKEEKNNPSILFAIQQSRFGLGVYASAQQHHTDVIRQHIPGIKSNNSNRPVLLNHFGQVIVASTDDSHNV